jgi:nitrite reductase/ring-hydroxylating ferredoxin subunit
VLNAATTRLERSPTLEKAARLLHRAVAPLGRSARVTTLLSGTGLGHPAHPWLVTAPIGAWTAASSLNLLRRHPAAARALVGAGVALAAPAAITGASDWLYTEGAERRVGVAHAGLNLAAVAAYTASWALRPRRRHAGEAAGYLGAVLASAAGWLGGHLAYGLGVGVDTNAFSTGPADWTPAGVAPAPGTVELAEAGGHRVALVGLDGGPVALGDRCSHRGGPLSEGEIVDGCVTCPWHGSRFDARTGRPRRGPASLPQPVLEVRAVDGGLQVRRVEPRALRTNPV